MVLTQLTRTDIIISYLKKFPYHYGSYATYRSWAEKLQPKNVSIPLWFLRNDRKEVTPPTDHLFPYHYGSYATPDRYHFRVGEPAFPYHYGSYATNTFPGSSTTSR